MLFLCSKLQVYMGWHWSQRGSFPTRRIFLYIRLNVETMSRGLWTWPSLCRHRLGDDQRPIDLRDNHRS